MAPTTHANMDRHDAPLGRDPTPGVLTQFSGELLWPKLLRSVGLAIRPERLFVAGVMVVLIALVLKVPGASWWAGESWARLVEGLLLVDWTQVAWRLLRLDVEGAAAPFLEFIAICGALWEAHWWTTLIVAPVVLAIWGVGGCVISRIAACDMAQGMLVPWMEGRKFALERAGSILFGLLAPLALGVLIWFALAAAGWVLFSVAWVNVAGGVLYVFFVLAAVLAVLVVAVYALGFPLIVPAVAVEGADGIDALARAYPYVLGRPLRYAAYVIILLLLGHVAVTVVNLAADGVVSFASGAATAWTGESANRVIGAGTEGSTEGLTGSERVAAGLVKFWTNLVRVIVAAFVVSYFFCGSTVLYLLMRRVCDGQDTGELWMPGMIEGTMAATMEARVKAAAAAVVPRPGAEAADDT